MSERIKNKIKSCNECQLCGNQSPLLDNREFANVFWVGLSAVKVDDVEDDTPLSEHTNSGKLIHTIEQSARPAKFYRTNLVKCLPLNGGKIRYPSKSEMKKCSSNFNLEVEHGKPKLVFLLGKQVSDFVFDWLEIPAPQLSETFSYTTHFYDGAYYIPVHHPSFILVYKRRRLDEYVANISKIITQHTSTKGTRRLSTTQKDRIAIGRA